MPNVSRCIAELLDVADSVTVRRRRSVPLALRMPGDLGVYEVVVKLRSGQRLRQIMLVNADLIAAAKAGGVTDVLVAEIEGLLVKTAEQRDEWLAKRPGRLPRRPEKD